MAQTRDETRVEGSTFAFGAACCWVGCLTLAYPSPLDVGKVVEVAGDVMVISKISPITGTGAMELFSPLLKGER